MKRSHQDPSSSSSVSSPVSSRLRGRSRLAAAACAVALCALILPGPAAHAGIGGSGYAKPLPPTTPLTACLQQCFEQYLKNHERCKSLFCDTFLFITLNCDDAGFAMCKAHAEDLIDSCIAGCAVANP